MAWNNPKKDWKAGDTPNSEDFNRIEGNIDILGRLDRTSAYGVATGTNNYTVTLDLNLLAYYEGMCIAVKIGNQNTGVSTLNVNGLGAKSIRKQNGNAVSAGNLKAGIIYTMRYNGTNFILQGEGGEGTAQVGDVLAGKTFTNDVGTFTGNIPNIGIQRLIPEYDKDIVIEKGYHNGDGYVKRIKRVHGTIPNVSVESEFRQSIYIGFRAIVMGAGMSFVQAGNYKFSGLGAQGWGSVNTYVITDGSSRAISINAGRGSSDTHLDVWLVKTGSTLVYGSYDLHYWAIGFEQD